jgi:tRNA pseudouridine38/39 synthase
MMAILFMVGKGLEEPSIVSQLLDVSCGKGRPTYLMAPERPLCLFDTTFTAPLQWHVELASDCRRGTWI